MLSHQYMLDFHNYQNHFQRVLLSFTQEHLLIINSLLVIEEEFYLASIFLNSSLNAHLDPCNKFYKNLLTY